MLFRYSIQSTVFQRSLFMLKAHLDLPTASRYVYKSHNYPCKTCSCKFSDNSNDFKIIHGKGIEAADSELRRKNKLSESIDQFPSPEDLQFIPGVIYDFDEENLLRKEGLWDDNAKPQMEIEPEIIYERGIKGVFDIEELVELLRSQRALDVVAIHIPPELKFANHMVIATGKTIKHLDVLAETTVKIHKKKKHKNDPFIKVEGKGSNWVAVDMGNIILHLMNEEVREEKNLETLWAVGAKWDEASQNISEEYGMGDLMHQYGLQDNQ